MKELNADATATQTKSSSNLFGRLSLMMFLQYFVQGAYQPVVTVYVLKTLKFGDMQAGSFSAALAVGPLIAPFLVGQLVDRYSSTERVMAVCHFLSGSLMLVLYTQTGFWSVLLLGTAYSVLYVPTMMLSNSLAFRHLKDSDLEFPRVRLFGTIGFMVPAYLIEFGWLRGLEGEAMDRARGIVFVFSGIVGILMGIYCLTLPHTPPQPSNQRKYAPGAVLRMLGQRHFLVLVLVSFLIAITHKFFWFWNSPFLRDILDSGGWKGAYEQSISSIGQLCEIGVMAVLGLMIRRLGFKKTMMWGAIAYCLRCVLLALVFALNPPFVGKMVLACLGQALHGVCFGCFLAAAYMYVDRVAPRDVRGSMQTFYGTFVIAVGFFLGGFFSGWIGRLFSTLDGEQVIRNWTAIWLACAVLAALCVAALAVFFPATIPAAERSSG